MPPSPPDRRTLAGLLGVSLASLALPGCGYFDDKTRTASPRTTGSAKPSSRTIGTGAVKVALLLPLTGSPQGGATATSLRDAAELAMGELQAPNLKLLVKDDRGTPEGAREAARAALAEGAELILGPLFAPAVGEVAAVASPARVPVLAFSTDAAVARRGVYLLSFMPQSEVERLMDHAAEHGKRAIASLVPETAYGLVVEGQFREAAARRGIAVAGAERYRPGEPGPAVGRLASLWSGGGRPSIDGLLLPDGGDGLALAGDALMAARFDPRRVRPLGTGVWNDPRALAVPAVAGGWFAAPEAAGFNSFAERYRARFGSAPARIATLSYDAVSLAAAMAGGGKGRITEAALENPAGFAGADGVFRLRADGVNERALAILEVRNGTAAIVSPAPKALGPSGA